VHEAVALGTEDPIIVAVRVGQPAVNLVGRHFGRGAASLVDEVARAGHSRVSGGHVPGGRGSRRACPEGSAEASPSRGVLYPMFMLSRNSAFVLVRAMRFVNSSIASTG